MSHQSCTSNFCHGKSSWRIIFFFLNSMSFIGLYRATFFFLQFGKIILWLIKIYKIKKYFIWLLMTSLKLARIFKSLEKTWKTMYWTRLTIFTWSFTFLKIIPFFLNIIVEFFVEYYSHNIFLIKYLISYISNWEWLNNCDNSSPASSLLKNIAVLFSVAIPTWFLCLNNKFYRWPWFKKFPSRT